MMFNRKNVLKNYNVYETLQELKNKDNNEKIDKIDYTKKEDKKKTI